MIEVWQKINIFFNTYGGLISTVSLIISIFIYYKTGQIKKNIKVLLNHEKYVSQKKKTKSRLESILESIQKDEIFDKKILGEVSREISTLEHYTIFFDKKAKRNMKNINLLLQNKFDNLPVDELIVAINKIIGDLAVNETFLG